MPGVGIGGLFSDLFHPNQDADLARAITPNPSPLAQQGPQPGSGGQGQPAANVAPAATTQPDPSMAHMNELLMQSYRQSQYAADLNRNIAGVAAGFGTAQQQASKQAALAGMPGAEDTLGAVSKIQGIDQANIDQNEHARFMANAAVFAQVLSQSLGRPVSVQEATEIMNNKGLMDQFGQAAAGNATFTGTQKDAEAATREWAKGHPDATAKDIADYKANLIAGGMTGGDLETRQYLDEYRNGITKDDLATWKAKKAAEAAGLTTHSKDVTEAKDQAVLDLPNIEKNLSTSEDIINKLLAKKKATIDAINTMPSRKTGWWASNTLWGASEDIREQAALVQQLMSTLAGEGLKNVKNVRNQREFQALADSLSAGLRTGNTDAGIEATLNDLLRRFATTRSIAREQAGLPAEEKKAEGDGGSSAPKIPTFNRKTGNIE